MGGHGYFELKDYRIIAEQINNGYNVAFNYSMTNGTAFVISIFPHFKALNHLSHGQPYGRIFVGIMFNGYFHFDPTIQQYPSYIGEKLNLTEEDAIPITELLNAIFPLLK